MCGGREGSGESALVGDGTDEDVRDADAREDGEEAVYPPEYVDGETPCVAPGGYDDEGEHLDGGHERYAYAGEACCFNGGGGDGLDGGQRRCEQASEEDCEKDG